MQEEIREYHVDGTIIPDTIARGIMDLWPELSLFLDDYDRGNVSYSGLTKQVQRMEKMYARHASVVDELSALHGWAQEKLILFYADQFASLMRGMRDVVIPEFQIKSMILELISDL